MTNRADEQSYKRSSANHQARIYPPSLSLSALFALWPEVVAPSPAVPTGERSDAKCARTCSAPYGSGAHVTFQSGRVHVYDYSSDVVTTLAGATDEQSRLHVTATAEIAANSACDLTLQVRLGTDSSPGDR